MPASGTTQPTTPEPDKSLDAFIVSTYNAHVYGEIGVTPLNAWRGQEWLPRIPESLEALDTLLVMVAKPRVVHRDGIHFEGLRFSDPMLAVYVGDPMTIRYDPRDVRVFHRNAFLCHSVSPEHAGQSITLKDVQAARVAFRRWLGSELKERKARVADFLPAMPRTAPPSRAAPKPAHKRPLLRIYIESD